MQLHRSDSIFNELSVDSHGTCIQKFRRGLAVKAQFLIRIFPPHVVIGLISLVPKEVITRIFRILNDKNYRDG